MKIFGLLLLLAATALAAEAPLSWKQTDNSLALIQGDQKVWQFNFKKDEGKPYFHPVTLAGSETLTDFRPADHFWHRALWFSWKAINNLNYWEEDPKTGKSQGETEVLDAKITPRENHSAAFALNISYHPPGKPAVLTEKRLLEVTAPAANGAWSIDWTSTFTAADADVLLDRTPIVGEPQGVPWGGYAGLSLRLAPALKKWHFEDGFGSIKGTSKDAKWVAFTGPLPDGKTASIIVLSHPQSFRHPPTWYLINDMPYFSPAMLYKSPYTLPAKQSFTLKYRILLQPGPLDPAAIEKQFERFAKN